MHQTIYLMRHAQTLFNSQDRIQGWSDSPLTEKGIAQAKIAEHYFTDRKIRIDRAYASTSERASDTLELVTDLPYQRLKGLREWNYGTFEAQPVNMYPYNHDTDFFPLFGGESDQDVQKRITATMMEIVTTDNSPNKLVVSHGGTIRSFVRAWQQHEASHEYLHYENCCILKFFYEDGIFSFQEMFNSDFSSLD
ncbi:histidine phosphatase family protein [Xylocopilactobacillus apicola]|uniref:Phosphoglycerate mutase n=1 Tax=Xylocopilactobacillus apicola TaxID=2932184 RepID=A0AAU9D3B4_9LACO|nr:histidine phosphatase family protein [Xylocopilactobacillus apicola]BDR59316.1 phosphoglycerate mutase [Xylocopilactobacillus apicola]